VCFSRIHTSVSFWSFSRALLHVFTSLSSVFLERIQGSFACIWGSLKFFFYQKKKLFFYICVKCMLGCVWCFQGCSDCLLLVYRALLSACRALLRGCGSVLRVCRAVFSVLRSLPIVVCMCVGLF